MGERAGQVGQSSDIDDRIAVEDAEIQQTREEMSETLDAIQAKLAPERLTDDAKDAAMETVDHVLERVKETFPELAQQAEERARQAVDHALAEAKETAQGLSEVASVAAMEAVDHALEKVKETFPDLAQQAQDAAREAVDHAIEEAKTAVRELTVQTRAAVRDATIGRVERMATNTTETSKYVGSTMVQTIRQNPGPAALTALGLSWLVLNGRSTKVGTASSSTATGGSQGGQSSASQLKGAGSDAMGNLQSGISGATDQVQETASEIGGQVQETVSGAADQVQQTAGQLVTQAQQVPSRLRQIIETNPVPLGLVGIALGSAAALAIPETRRENELLGQTRDALVQKAETAAQTTLEKVQDVTEAVGETVEKEAKYAGLTSESK